MIQSRNQNKNTVALWLKVCFFMIALGIAWLNTSWAGIENRSLNTDDAGILDRYEATSAFGFVYTGDNQDRDETDLTIDVGFGVTHWLEVTAQLPVVFLHPGEEGLGDIQVRPEIQLLDEKTYLPAMSVAGSVKFQSGDEDRGLGSGETDWSVSGQFSKTVKRLTLHINVGFTIVGETPGTDLDNVIFYGVAGEYSFTDHLSFVGEVIGETNSDPTADENPVEYLTGFTYELPGGFTVDFGVGGGLNNGPTPDFRITSGLTYSYQFD